MADIDALKRLTGQLGDPRRRVFGRTLVAQVVEELRLALVQLEEERALNVRLGSELVECSYPHDITKDFATSQDGGEGNA